LKIFIIKQFNAHAKVCHQNKKKCNVALCGIDFHGVTAVDNKKKHLMRKHGVKFPNIHDWNNYFGMPVCEDVEVKKFS
jgi:uncharacterized DUF497 family protein